ncbi:hypothetical protein [Providencia stuartii]|uniref:hypothetical protein n=2 Tax=Morganellaceae TaxID=1903414 RepID=UPI0033256BC1
MPPQTQQLIFTLTNELCAAFYLREVVMSNQHLESVISELSARVTALELASHQQGEVISTLSDRMGKSPEGGDDVIFVDKLTAPPMKLRS